eukprot:GHVT01070668.1.p3 GENE.GHVT01070668.1~~GHVT01070668.1.p3  ORF type:complete len:124 (-),score=34.31 GHVT01070668.1:1078-1449(-)
MGGPAPHRARMKGGEQSRLRPRLLPPRARQQQQQQQQQHQADAKSPRSAVWRQESNANKDSRVHTSVASTSSCPNKRPPVKSTGHKAASKAENPHEIDELNPVRKESPKAAAKTQQAPGEWPG